MKFISASLLIACALAMCLFTGAQTSKDEKSKDKQSSYVWMIDRTTHQLKKVQAGPGVPTYDHINFPIEQTTNYQKRPTPAQQQHGCDCGYDPQFLPHSMIASPSSIPNATVGQDVTLNYDASEICKGQMIDNTNDVHSPDPRRPDNPALNLGTADWQVGNLQSLPREWGRIILPGGYTQSGTYNITIHFQVHCSDSFRSCRKACSTQVSVPITVH